MNKLRLRNKNMSIFPKVLFGYMFLIVIVLAVSGFLSYLQVRNYIIDDNQTEMLKKAQVIADIIGHRTPDWRAIREYQNMADVEIVVIGTDYVAMQSPARKPVLPEREDEDSEIKLTKTQIISSVDQAIVDSILSGACETGLSRLDFVQNQIVYAGAPVYAGDGTIAGAVLLFRQLRDIDGIWQRFSVYIAYAAMISVLIAVLLATAFTRRLTKPLYELNAAAKRMAEGEYGNRVQIRKHDEVGQLGDTLNLLSGRLEEVIDNLYSEKSKLEQIFLGIGEGVIAVDIQGTPVRMNAAVLELMETDAWDAPETEEQTRQKEALKRALLRCMETGERESATWSNPSGRAIAAAASPVRDSAGEITGAVGLLRDVSEAQRLEQLRRDYIANISHELRTPLTGIRGMVEPLLDGMLETEAEKRDSYQIIYRETLRLQKLITEMLDMSRLQDGRLKLALEPVELTSVLDGACQSMRAQAEAAGVALSVVAKGPVMAMGDEDRVLQVLVILIDNALSFTPAGGSVTVCVTADDKRARVGVRDTGVGIEPQHLPYIWERFYKADKSRMRTTGTGLGLSIAKLIVELMGGTIGVTTEVGKGTEFSFTLNNLSNNDK